MLGLTAWTKLLLDDTQSNLQRKEIANFEFKLDIQKWHHVQSTGDVLYWSSCSQGLPSLNLWRIVRKRLCEEFIIPIILRHSKNQKSTWKVSGMKAFLGKGLEELVWDSILKDSRLNLVSFTTVFWMSRNAPPLCDIQETVAKETRLNQNDRASKRSWFALIKNL